MARDIIINPSKMLSSAFFLSSLLLLLKLAADLNLNRLNICISIDIHYIFVWHSRVVAAKTRPFVWCMSF